MTGPGTAAADDDAAVAELEPILAEFRRHFPHGDAGLLVRAYAAAARAHQGQLRRTGDPYITHPLAVARILAGLRPRRRDDGRGPAPRRPRGHRPDPRRGARRVRRHGGRSHRRGHQARPHPLQQPRRGPGGHHPQDGHRHGPRRAGPAHQAGRPPAQRAHPPRPAPGEAAAHRRPDPGGLRPAGSPPRGAAHQARAGGPLLRHPLPAAARRDPGAAADPGLQAGCLHRGVHRRGGAPAGRAADRRRP